MEVRKLNKEELKEVYNLYMLEDFPKEELKPYEMIEYTYDLGKYEALGFYEEKGKNLVAYAMLIKNKKEYLLLDYFAVISGIRNEGYGSKALHCMKKIYENTGVKAIIIEIEDVEYALSIKERDIRKRRKKFYLSNGVSESKVVVRFFEVEYNLLYMNFENIEMSNEILYKEYINILKSLIPQERLETNLECLKCN